MAFEGDQGSMANTLFPIYQRQTGLNGSGGVNGEVPYVSFPSVPLQELDSGSYLPWSHNTHEDPFELINYVQNHIKNRKPSDVADDVETELQGLVSNILDEADSQDSFYSDGSLSQRSRNIWSPKILRDELLQYFQAEPKTQYSSNFAPNYTSHDSFGKAPEQAVNKEAEELCQATSNGYNTNQHMLFNVPNGIRDIFSAQQGSHKPPPGLPLPNNSYIPLQQNNYDNMPVSREGGNGESMSGFPDLSHVFRPPQSEMNGTDIFCEDHYNQAMDKPAANEYTPQDLNQLVNSFQSFVAGEEEGCEFPPLSMPATIQHDGSLADKWRSPSPFTQAQGNNSAQMQRQLGMDFGSTLTERNRTRKQLFKRDSLQDLSSFNMQTSEFSPQAKLPMGHQNKMLLQRENVTLPVNMNQFAKHQIQQSMLKFTPQTHREKRMAGFFGDGFNARPLSGDILPEEKRPALSQNPYYDLPVNARPQRFERESNLIGGSSQQLMPFMYAGNDPRRHPGQLPAHAFSPQPSLTYRVGDMVAANEMSGFSSSFNNGMSRGGENTYHGMSPNPALSAPAQMNQGGPVFQLFFYLDECYEQWRCLEKERKKTEIVLSKTFLGKRTTALPNSSLPRTPPNPSKVDHLIVNQMREEARVSSLLDKMECLSGVPINSNIYSALKKHHMAISVTSARRREEITNGSHNQHNQRPRAHFTEDKVSDTMLLVVALKDLAATTRKLRTAVWCALQMTLPKPVPTPEPPVSEEKPDEAAPAQCGGYSYRL